MILASFKLQKFPAGQRWRLECCDAHDGFVSYGRLEVFSHTHDVCVIHVSSHSWRCKQSLRLTTHFCAAAVFCHSALRVRQHGPHDIFPEDLLSFTFYIYVTLTNYLYLVGLFLIYLKQIFVTHEGMKNKNFRHKLILMIIWFAQLVSLRIRLLFSLLDINYLISQSNCEYFVLCCMSNVEPDHRTALFWRCRSVLRSVRWFTEGKRLRELMLLSRQHLFLHNMMQISNFRTHSSTISCSVWREASLKRRRRSDIRRSDWLIALQRG